MNFDSFMYIIYLNVLPNIFHGIHVEWPKYGPDITLVGTPGAGDPPDHRPGF